MIGKTVFVWNTPLVLGGNPSAIADKLLEGNFEGVILKVADGNRKHFTRVGMQWVEAVSRETVRVLQARGLKVYGYGFNYGIDVVGEGHIAVAQSLALKLDGYVFDVEGSFEQKAKAAGGRTLGGIFKAGAPNVPAFFCSWAMFRSWTGGTWHDVEVHRAFLEWCDGGMPMCYWPGTSPANAVRLLEESLRQWRSITSKPIYPVGRAYNGDAGWARADAIGAFGDRVRELQLKGESWWVLDSALKLDPSIWQTLRALPRFAPEVGPAPPTVPTPEWAVQADSFIRTLGYAGPRPNG